MWPPVALDSVATNMSRLAELNTIKASPSLYHAIGIIYFFWSTILKEWLGIADLPEIYPMFTSENETDYVPGYPAYLPGGPDGK